MNAFVMKSMEMLAIENCYALMVTEKQNIERYVHVFSKVSRCDFLFNLNMR